MDFSQSASRSAVAVPKVGILSQHEFEFASLCTKVAELVKSTGRECVALTAAEAPIFSSLSADQQLIALKDIQSYYGFLMASWNSVADARDELRAFEFFYRIKFADELFQHIADTDVIEIYTADSVQVWRNLNFFRVCSYTLEEIFCEDWPSRYVRDSNSMEEIMNAVRAIQDPTLPPVLLPEIKPHYLYETHSHSKLVLSADFHCFARTVQSRATHPYLWMGASKAKVIGSLEKVGDPFRLRAIPSESREPDLF